MEIEKYAIAPWVPATVISLVLCACPVFASSLGYSLPFAIGTVVRVGPSTVVISDPAQGRMVEFAVKYSDRKKSLKSLNKGDRVKIWYSLELRKLELIKGDGEKLQDEQEPSGEELEDLPDSRKKIDDRAFYGA